MSNRSSLSPFSARPVHLPMRPCYSPRSHGPSNHSCARRLALRIYFKRIEVTGLEHVPLDSPVIFVLNHPNALVDPVFLLCLTPRRVSFLAKAPLFRMPVIGYLVRALESLPVYRRQDEGEDVSKNQETFIAARKLLARGGTIGICPEGVSHDDPGLKPIKTGAARIALAAVATGEVSNLQIVHEDQRLARLDDAAGAAVAVAEVRRDDQPAAAADLHPLHAGVPAGDDLADAEAELQRRAAVVGRVELLAQEWATPT